MKYLVLTLVVLGQVFFQVAQAGPITSGGGQSVVCINENQTIASAEMFDLYEGRVLYDWLPLSDQRDYKLQLSDIIGKLSTSRQLDPFFADELNRELIAIEKRTRFIQDAEIKIIDDSKSPIIPHKPCVLAQVAIYDSTGFIFINKMIWNHFDETSKAALIFHEALYSYLRKTNETTSVRTRRIVSYLFSGKNFKNKKIPSDYIVCTSKQSKVYLYLSNGWLEILLDTVSGTKNFGSTTLLVNPGSSITDSLNEILRNPGGIGSGRGSAIEQLSPIDFELGASFLFTVNPKNKLNFYGKALSRIEMNDPNSNSTFEKEEQFTCAPSNSYGTNSEIWYANFPIQSVLP